MTDRATECADELNGSCKSLSDVATPDEINNMEFCNALDALVMQCESCGWWVDAEEINTDSGEARCNDCEATE